MTRVAGVVQLALGSLAAAVFALLIGLGDFAGLAYFREPPASWITPEMFIIAGLLWSVGFALSGWLVFRGAYPGIEASVALSLVAGAWFIVGGVLLVVTRNFVDDLPAFGGGPVALALKLFSLVFALAASSIFLGYARHLWRVRSGATST